VRRAAARAVLALLVAALLPACAGPAPAVARSAQAGTLSAWLDAARLEVAAVHADMAAARRARDLDAVLAVRSEDFSATRADGRQVDRAGFEAALRDFDARLLELHPASGSTIERIEDWTPRRPWASGDDARLVLRVRRRFQGVVQPESGPPQEVALESLARETWRRTAQGWRLERVEELGG